MLENEVNSCDSTYVLDRANAPHPIPYQGSKRSLAPEILAFVGGRQVRRFYEPFAGSAALTIAAARAGIGSNFVIGDTLGPLIEMWRFMLANPVELADRYARIWNGQQTDDLGYYTSVRQRFNEDKDPASLLYLLARCVKNSPRWNREGLFNQSADKRRLGAHPDRMRRQILGVYHLLSGKAIAVAGDFEQTIADAKPQDLVYLDPPWQGTSGGRDTRYHQGLSRERLINVLESMNKRGIPWLLSYDGRCGEKTYGASLPLELAERTELSAGRSSQATLNGVEAMTVESLYVSSAVHGSRPTRPRQRSEQLSLLTPRVVLAE